MTKGFISSFKSIWSPQIEDNNPMPTISGPMPVTPNVRNAIAENLRKSRDSQKKSSETEDYYRRQRVAMDGVLKRLGDHNGGCD